MDTRITFGATGLSVSPICFGTWQLSPRFWGDVPKADMLAAMRGAVDVGVNFFDTADAYGDGHAETVLGEFLREAPRDEVVVCTKVFNHFNPDASRYPDMSPDHVRERCDIQLRRLGTETIDLYLVHMFDPLTPAADVAAALDGLREQGKIRHYGVSNFSVEQLRAYRRFGSYNAVQPPYSLLDPPGEGDLLPYCEAEDVGVTVYSPLHKGLLTGKYDGSETFNDFRQFHPDFQNPRFTDVAEAVRSLAPIASGYDMSISQLVLAATLMHPAIHVAAVGIKKPAHIAEAAGAMGRALSRPDYFAVRKALQVNTSSRIRNASNTQK